MVYLSHFEEKRHHAQHYLGFVQSDLSQRLGLHFSGVLQSSWSLPWTASAGTRMAATAILNESPRTAKKQAWFAAAVAGRLGPALTESIEGGRFLFAQVTIQKHVRIK